MAQQDDQLETGLLVAEAEHVIAERRAGGSYASNLSDLDEGASSLGSVFTLCNSAIGAGVLSLPYAFKCAGAPLGRYYSESMGNCWCSLSNRHVDTKLD